MSRRPWNIGKPEPWPFDPMRTAAPWAWNRGTALYLPMWEGAGVPRDFGAYRHTVAQVGTVPWIVSRLGRATDVSSSSNLWSIADHPSLRVANDFAIEILVEPTSTGGEQAAISKSIDGGAPNRAYEIGIRSGNWRANAFIDGTYDYFIAGSIAAAVGQPAHVVSTRIGTVWSLYVNGRLAGSRTLSGPLNAHTGSLYLGALLGNGAENFVGHFYLASVRGYGLTAAEVAALAADPYAPFRPVRRRSFVVVSSGGPAYSGDLDAAADNASADFAGTYAPPEYAGSLSATAASAGADLSGEYRSPPMGSLSAGSSGATASLVGAYAPPEYIGALAALSGAGSADFAGTYDAPGYSGGLTATSGGSSGSFAGTYAVPEYAGDLAAASPAASAGFTGAYTAPGFAGSLSAASQPASASFSGTYAVPEYEGALSAASRSASGAFAGDYTPPPGGVLQVVSGPAAAAFAGSYAAPVYDGELAGLSQAAEAAFAGSYAVPVYAGALAALSGPATARFTEDTPPVAAYLTGRLTVRPTLRGSLTVSPTLTGTLTVRPG